MKKKLKLKHQPHDKFKGFLVENKIRQRTVAEMLGISPVTLNQKINGYLHFTFAEVEKICNEYKIDPSIFLTKKLRDNNKNKVI